ncbi:MAG: hypothetical protein IPJ93_12795 [Bacteroidota bacterium]|nr:MAG: hypothetical protein IPJ93_12795 [Bacteroidota bacterium]
MKRTDMFGLCMAVVEDVLTALISKSILHQMRPTLACISTKPPMPTR